MNEYWKDPRLDDEGTYDYLVEELPSDTAKWEHGYRRCESCGKEHWLNFTNTHYFYCYDGWDSMSYTECWKCRLKNKINSIMSKIKRKIKMHQEYRKWVKNLREKGVQITSEVKEMILNKINKGVMR